ncbi:cryptochrome/photolyase family protein [Methylomagnum ishizawai]|uniref:cryptochrome/photolyase family protein n=1 Tax=Methylomagnum ishizawai TaxID=1760988 RepID=UPI001C3224B7|nr:deoxyribodipyrimidine photo-lyase [Methylomagnum ishizawai]BBL75838.1 deoxyribodipyrimidine photo-lyase [Methylomagnum ishizawai]
MKTAMVWFRQDLRLADNPALRAALAAAERVVPVYIHAPVSGGTWPMGSASRWWLHHSLMALDADLRRLGSRLVLRRGASFQVLAGLLAETGATAVYWNRCYEPSAIARDAEIKRVLRNEGYFTVESHNSGLLYEPWELLREGGQPYRVFTPFWKAMQKRGLDFPPEPAPADLPPVADELWSLAVGDLGLLPRIPWDAGFREGWQPGEDGAARRLAGFIDSALAGYHERRDRPDLPDTSRLSPYLHFGEVGPRQIVHAVRRALPPEAEAGAEAYVRELAWREFAHHLLYHFPDTTDAPLDAKFEAFPWATDDQEALTAWQRGQTGYPLVDAGMRELWRTGWMHNRVRMVVASLLTKNLLIPWRKGARWFWDTLVDADLANNTLGWQWTAGCGADAAPYFRVFNPVLQGQRFDPDGAYVRRWVPELAGLPDAAIHRPWEAAPAVLREAGVRLGETYPLPIVDLKSSRERALAAFARLKAAG